MTHSTACELHGQAIRESISQAGVLRRDQLLSFMRNPEAISRQVRAGRWQRLFPGTYATFTGEPSVQAWWWAAHLFGGQASVLCAESALQSWGLQKPALPVHLAVPHQTHLSERPGLLVVRRFRSDRPAGKPKAAPPTCSIEYALLDVAEGCESLSGIADALAEAFRLRLTSPKKIRRTLDSRPRFRHRFKLETFLRQFEQGCTNQFEADTVRLVLVPHGLPRGVGQVREYSNGRQTVRDRVLEGVLVLELDGQLGHSLPTDIFRDLDRDNDVSLSGRTTIRLGWHAVYEQPCEAALKVAQGLRINGWLGVATPCGPSCIVDR